MGRTLSARRGAGDWIDSGNNLIAIGNSSAGETQVLCAIGPMQGRWESAAARRALIEAGFRVLHTRSNDIVRRAVDRRPMKDLEYLSNSL